MKPPYEEMPEKGQIHCHSVGVSPDIWYANTSNTCENKKPQTSTVVIIDARTSRVTTPAEVVHVTPWHHGTIRAREIAGKERGIQRDDVTVWRYPAVLPDAWILALHDRMPVLLDASMVRSWIFNEMPHEELLRPARNDLLQVWPVSTDVNRVGKMDDAHLIAAVG